jgi:hypothetical protein
MLSTGSLGDIARSWSLSLHQSFIFQTLPAQHLCSKEIHSLKAVGYERKMDATRSPLSLRALALEPPNASLLRRFSYALRADGAMPVPVPPRGQRPGLVQDGAREDSSRDSSKASSPGST